MHKFAYLLLPFQAPRRQNKASYSAHKALVFPAVVHLLLTYLGFTNILSLLEPVLPCGQAFLDRMMHDNFDMVGSEPKMYSQRLNKFDLWHRCSCRCVAYSVQSAGSNCWVAGYVVLDV